MLELPVFSAHLKFVEFLLWLFSDYKLEQCSSIRPQKKYGHMS